MGQRHSTVHPDYVDGCFACKIQTLQFDRGWGPSRQQSRAAAEVAHDLGTDQKETQEKILDRTRGVGHLMWKNNEPYKKNRVDGTWERASADDMETMLGRTSKESSRTY